DTGRTGMHVTTTEFLRGHHLAGGGLHQRWATEKNCSLVTDDHGFVAHCRNISAPCRAGAEDRGDLGNPPGGHCRLVVEDPPEVFPIGEDLVLLWQERATGV